MVTLLHDFIRSLLPNGCNGLSGCRCTHCLLSQMAHEVSDSNEFVRRFIYEPSYGRYRYCYPFAFAMVKDKGCQCVSCKIDRAALEYLEGLKPVQLRMEL